jgi:hypothetical protein
VDLHATSAFERLIHFALFSAAGLTLAVAALALIERVAGDGPDGRRTIRLRHILGAVGLMFLLFGVERIYHAL